MQGKRKARMGRPPKRPSERKSTYVNVPVEKSRLKAYQAAAKVGFKGVVTDFIRAACDDLAARLTATETQLKRERDAFRSGTDDAAEQFERDKPPAKPKP
jgi:hypothetical protein